jgi:membrane peptidoglycan carboxypeptidase
MDDIKPKKIKVQTEGSTPDRPLSGSSRSSNSSSSNSSTHGAGHLPDSLLYANIGANSRKHKRETKKIEKAKRLANMPHTKFRRFLYYMNPRNLFGFVFSKRGFKLIFRTFAVLTLVFGLIGVATFAYFRRDVSKLNPEEISRRIQNSSVKYYDRTGTVLLWEYKGDKDRTVVEYDQISNYLKQATISLEDRRFYEHNGFDPKGFGRAVIGRGENGGGSTITQQLVKNELLEDNEKTISRKIKELILALEVERTYSKEQILTMYLNAINYGGTSYGIESGAQRYFRKSAKDLNLGESVLLASIPQRPSRYDPYSAYFSQDILEGRMKAALKGMVEMGSITQSEADAINPMDVIATVQPKDEVNQYKDIKAPHFILDVQDKLFQRYGEQNVRRGGYEVVTSLDWDLQQKAEEAVNASIKGIEAGGGSNAGLVSVDVATSQVLAMVGSRDFNYPKFGAVNVTTSKRQPGSSIKPFTYAQLFYKDNWGAGSVILDTPKTWPGNPPYTPQNFDQKFQGPISVRSALDTSRNLPALRALEIGGIDQMVNLARDMGDKTLCNSCDYGLSVGLGSGEVRLNEHVQAYASFARGGKTKEEVTILKVAKSNGEVLEEWKDKEGQQVLNPENAYLINNILSDASARSPLFGGLESNLTIPGGVKLAIKTGTTNDKKDGWIMSYTPDIATGVWVGNNDATPMNGNTTIMTSKLLGSYLKPAYAIRGWSNKDFNRPSGIQELVVNGKTDIYPSWFKKPKELPGKQFTVDKVSKKLATSCTPDAAREVVNAIGTDAGEGTILYNVPNYDLENNDDIHSCDDPKPTASMSASSPPASPAVSTSNPKTVTFTIGVSPGKFSISSVEVVIDGESIQSAGISSNGSSTFVHQFITPGPHKITVNITDEGYYSSTINQTINIQ